MKSAAAILFLLAAVTLAITLVYYLRRPLSRHAYKRSTYLLSVEKRQRGRRTAGLLFQLSSAYEQFFHPRRYYYRNVYLKSDEWKRKRYVVLRRDNWRCVYCGARATQVHHLRYAKRNIGKEPIHWLVSICKPCHDARH